MDGEVGEVLVHGKVERRDLSSWSCWGARDAVGIVRGRQDEGRVGIDFEDDCKDTSAVESVSLDQSSGQGNVET